MKKTSFYWLRGVLVFAIVFVVMLVIGSLIQYYYGIWGVLATELMMLAITLTAAKIMHVNIKEMLPVKLPRIRQIFGIVFIYLGGIILIGSSVWVVFYFIPQSTQIVSDFSNLYSSTSGMFAWLIVAVSPAICEEFLHRGLILYTFKNSAFRSKWFIIIGVGLIFGVFHMSGVRFPAMCIQGMLLTYIALESGNILLPVFYHLLNNTISLLTGLNASQGVDYTNTSSLLDNYSVLSIIGTIFIISAFALYVLRLGARLIGPNLGKLESAARESAALDAAVRESAVLDTVALDAAKPDTAALDAATPDTTAPDAAAIETATSDAAASDTAALDTDAPDTAVPDATVLDAATPDTAASDTAALDTVALYTFTYDVTTLAQIKNLRASRRLTLYVTVVASLLFFGLGIILINL